MINKLLLKVCIAGFSIFLSRFCYGEPVTRVPLNIGQTNSNAIISWPYPSTGFDLQFSTNLGLANWQAVSGTSVSNNGRWEFTAPLNLPTRYFRLKNHVEHFGFWPGSIATEGSIIEQNGYVTFTSLQG